MSEDTTTDEELMARLQAGDDGALSILMTRWEHPIRRYLIRMMRIEADALDAAEEVFVRVYQHRDSFAPDGRFKAWFFTIATNLARSRYRWWKRHPGEALPDESKGYGNLPEALRADSTPASWLFEKEKFDMVRRAVATLPDDLRTVILLFEFEDLSYAEIAGVLHCSPKAVETRLYRARRQLRIALGPYLDDRMEENPEKEEKSSQESASRQR